MSKVLRADIWTSGAATRRCLGAQRAAVSRASRRCLHAKGRDAPLSGTRRADTWKSENMARRCMGRSVLTTWLGSNECLGRHANTEPHALNAINNQAKTLLVVLVLNWSKLKAGRTWLAHWAWTGRIQPELNARGLN